MKRHLNGFRYAPAISKQSKTIHKIQSGAGPFDWQPQVSWSWSTNQLAHNLHKYPWKGRWVVLAQWVEQSLSTPEIHGSNPYVSKILSFKIEKTKIKVSRPGKAHCYKNIRRSQSECDLETSKLMTKAVKWPPTENFCRPGPEKDTKFFFAKISLLCQLFLASKSLKTELELFNWCVVRLLLQKLTIWARHTWSRY